MELNIKRNSDLAVGGHVNRARPVLLEEQERLAYISGNIGTAKVLGELLDAQQADAVEQRTDGQAVLALTP